MPDKPTAPRVLLRGEDSDGRISMIETRPGPGAGPPLHHHDFDETFYVLEGELTFRLGEETLTLGPGELVHVPRGAVHTFANFSDAPAHQLIVCAPAGFERHFARMAAEIEGVDPPEWARQPSPEVVKVGPPLEAPGA